MLPEIVLLGLILINFFPPIILPKKYPPMSDPAHIDKAKMKKIASSKLFPLKLYDENKTKIK